MSATREQPVQHYSEVFELRAEGQGFVIEVDFHLRLASLFLTWKAVNTVFGVLSFSFQVWRYSPMVAMSLVSTPSTACQSPSACIIVGSSTYAYFLETVVWQVGGVGVEEKERQDRSLWDAFLRHRNLLLLPFPVVSVKL